MSQFINVEVKIEGTTPLLYHCFRKEVLALGRKAKNGTKGNDPSEWKSTYLVTGEGQFYIEGSYIFSSLRDAARLTKEGRSNYQKNLVSTLQVLDQEILIDRYMPNDEITTNKEKNVYLDVRSVINPGTRGRNLRYRVALNTGWKATFRIVWDQSIIAPAIMEAICHDSGAFSGLADGRAIGFGRFKVLEFKELENAQKKTS